MPQPPPPHKSILLGLLILVLVTGQCSSLSAAPHIQVCQNKDCCKRYQGRIDLFQTIHDLQLDAKVESSGCLSHCGQGPNIEIDGLVLHEITNAATAAVQLELTLGKPIPKLLLAAVQVLEKANGAPLEQQERFYQSVISKLMASEEFSTSGVLAHALSRRASYYLEQGDNHHAIDDALQVLAFGTTATAKTRSRVYRVLADAHEGLGNLKGAIQALQEWYEMDPIVRTKVQKEIQRLNELSKLS